MPNCPACGEALRYPEDLTGDLSCEKCGSLLTAKLRGKSAVMFVGALIGILLRFVSLALNPNFNLQKTAKFPLILVGWVTRISWQSKLVRIRVR
jgi:uncharacterized protein (DUF983 family)